MDKKEKIKKEIEAIKIVLSDAKIQERIDFVKWRLEDLESNYFQEEIKNRDPIIEAFQKHKLEESISTYKKAFELYEKALKINGKERIDFVREALIIETKADTINYIYSKEDIELKEEFETFSKNYK